MGPIEFLLKDPEVTEGLLSNRAPHAVAARLPIDQRHYVSHRSR